MVNQDLPKSPDSISYLNVGRDWLDVAAYTRQKSELCILWISIKEDGFLVHCWGWRRKAFAYTVPVIHLHLPRNQILKCSGKETKLEVMMRHQFRRVRSTLLLPFLPGLLWPEVLVFIWVPSRCQIDLLRNYSNLIGWCGEKVKQKITLQKQLQKKKMKI